MVSTGLRDVSLGVPCLITEDGVAQVVQSQLSPEEMQALSHSADVVRGALGELEG